MVFKANFLRLINEKTIFIGLILAIASSSAYAYVITSQKKTSTFGGAPNITYYIKCDSGVLKSVWQNDVSYTKTVYQITNGGPKQYSSEDQVAKAACKE